MLPDEKIGCHRTGFAMTCHEGVIKHKCQLWCHVSGTDHRDQPVDVYGCSDTLSIKLLHEVAKEVRHATASTDKVANEVAKASEASAARETYLINGLRASFPVLRALETGSDQWEWERLSQAGNGNGQGAIGIAHAPRSVAAERADHGDADVSAAGQERPDQPGED